MKAFYVVGTHWDREWYEPFQEFRMWLVELVDELLDLLEKDPEYRSFHLDGQAVVLEDYLEIRPENRERLVALLKSRRLLAGPWYDLPDEWLISGESFIRNLMRGMRVCREMGFEPVNYGYTPDQFGHIAALPMILTGFGLRAGICWRGAQDETHPAQFIWVGPDGSRMPTQKLLDRGSYGTFDFLFRRKLKDSGITDACFKEHFEPYIQTETERSPAGLILMLDAIDHQRPDPVMPELMREMVRRYPEIEFHWASLDEFADEMVDRASLMPERSGELREPARAADRGGQYLIVHTLSSRYPLKKRNDECQAAMEKWAEPYALFQAMAGGAPILSYLDTAWKYLLRNHPHDSICGCSIDQVHRDMHYRFDQCELIADGVVRRAMAFLGRASAAPEALTNVVIHNPLPFRRQGPVEVALPFRPDWPERFIDGLCSGEPINRFTLSDAAGQQVPFQLSAIERGVEFKVLRDTGRKAGPRGDLYHLVIEADLPPCGFAGFRIEPSKEAVRNFGSLLCGPMAAANDHFTFTLHPDGLATIVERATGRVYENLFLYEDCGDSGDGWTFGKLVNDLVYRGPGARVSTAIAEDGALRTVFRVEREFDLPERMDRRTGWRSAARTTLRVTDLIYVEKGAPCVRVRTHIANTCEDHRFRVLFPTCVDTPVSFAETPFAVVERAIGIPPETAGWHERVNPEKAFTSFFGVQDERGGLAVLGPKGLHEYEVLQSPDRSLAVTLFRSTFQTVGTSGEPDGQLLGPLDFEYLLYPFAGVFSPLEASRLVAAAQAGVRIHHREALPQPRSFLRVRNNAAVVTAIKPSDDRADAVVRFWNPGDEDVCEVVETETGVRAAQRCNLNEEPLSPIKLNADGSIPVQVPARGLATVRFAWKR